MSSLNLLRGGFKSVNVLLRPQSSFMGRAANLTRNKSVLYMNNQNQVRNNLLNQQPRKKLTTFVRGPDNIHDPSVTKHWNVERYVAIGLLALIPASLYLEHPVTDYLLGAGLVLHSQWGCHSIIIDYLHGPVLPKIGLNLLHAFAALAFLGICYFNYKDIGLSKAIKKLWTL